MVSLEKARDTIRGEAGQALRVGSVILARRAWGLIAPDAPVWQRLGYTAAGGYIAVTAAQSQPAVIPWAVPGAVLGWCVAAWTVAPATEPEPEAAEEPVQEPAEVAQIVFVRWLLATIGEQSGIHLQELYPAMRQLPGHGWLEDTQLRDALRTLDIPVRRSLRVGSVAGRSGVHRDDLPPLPREGGEHHVEIAGDAGQSPVSPPLSTVGEEVESA